MQEIGFGDNWSLSVRPSGLFQFVLTATWKVERWNKIEDDIPSSILRSNPNRYGKPEIDEFGPNKVVNVGLNHFLDCISGRFLDSGWAASSMYFANWNAAIGAGDSSVAEDASQTDLQAASNKTRVHLNSGSPSLASGQQWTAAADFGNGIAVYDHNEVGFFNAVSGGKMACRKVVNAGTKGAIGTWTWSLVLAATSAT
jgi:hypothetical protein